jgi:rRNA maturation protein Rpf1
MIPNLQQVNRGATDLPTLTYFCRQHGMTDLVIVHSSHGQPDCLIISRLPYGLTAYLFLRRVVMRSKVENPTLVSSAFPHLVFEDLT